ncbi:MAG: hypothetical protein AABY22_08535, partial [Nanoarchaeota archaeon]
LDDCNKAVQHFELASKSFPFLPFSEISKLDYLELKRIISNNVEFMKDLSRGEMTTYSLQKWLDESGEANTLLKNLGKEFGNKLTNPK